MTWQDRARCAGAPDAIFFPSAGGSAHRAKAICRACPIRVKCLQYALEVEGDGISVRGRYGIYGGKTPDERAEMARRRRAA